MLTTVGIHPLAAVGIIAVDSMLFGGTVAVTLLRDMRRKRLGSGPRNR